MASEISIFSLYRLGQKHYLLRTLQPSFSNVSQPEENLALATEESQRAHLLQQILGRPLPADLKFLGELQGFPIGELLYAEKGNAEIPVYYQSTEYGHPWIILGTAGSEAEFLEARGEDEDLLNLRPTGEIYKVDATFFTPANFTL